MYVSVSENRHMRLMEQFARKNLFLSDLQMQVKTDTVLELLTEPLITQNGRGESNS